MHTVPLWQILHSLPQPSLREIAKMTVSPFFNQRDDVAALFQYLSGCLRSGNLPVREHAFACLYPDKPYDGAQLRLVLHFLTELVRQYLVWQQLRRSEGQYELLLAQALRQLSLDDLAQTTLRDAESALHRIPHQDPATQERRFQVQAESLRQSRSTARQQDFQLQALSDQLEKAYITRKLKVACELLSHQAVFPAHYDLGLLDAVLAHIQDTPDLFAAPEVALYYHCCLALLHPEETEHFSRLKPLLMRANEVFQTDECRDVMLLATNFCIRKLNAGDPAYAREGLELYQNALEKGYLLEKGELSRFTFRNVVGMGLRIQSFDWVEWFIAAYGTHIAAAHRESTVSFSRARLAYGRRHYREAMGLLQKADYDDLLLNLAAKTLLMKIYYEADEWRLLDSLLDSMAIFLRRKKIIGYHKKNYQNTVRFCKKLVAVNRLNADAVEALRKEIREEETLTEREWFLEQLKKEV